VAVRGGTPIGGGPERFQHPDVRSFATGGEKFVVCRFCISVHTVILHASLTGDNFPERSGQIVVLRRNEKHAFLARLIFLLFFGQTIDIFRLSRCSVTFNGSV